MEKLERRTFLGAVIVGTPIAAGLGPTMARQVEQLEALPLAPPPVGGIEWLVKQAEPLRAALGRYQGQLTEQLLLEAVSDCGFKPRTVLLSMVGVKDYVERLAGERRYSGVDTHDLIQMEDHLVYMAPGRHVSIECHFSLPAGTLAIS